MNYDRVWIEHVKSKHNQNHNLLFSNLFRKICRKIYSSANILITMFKK